MQNNYKTLYNKLVIYSFYLKQHSKNLLMVIKRTQETFPCNFSPVKTIIQKKSFYIRDI